MLRTLFTLAISLFSVPALACDRSEQSQLAVNTQEKEITANSRKVRINYLLGLAKQGDSETMYSLFLELGGQTDGKGPPSSPQEEKEGIKWLFKSASLNNWRAASVLEMCYRKGCLGLKVDDKKSEHYKEILQEFKPIQ